MESAAAEGRQPFKDRAPTHSADLSRDASAEETVTIRQRVLWLFDKVRKRAHDPYRYLLVLRFLLLNLVAFALVGAAYVQGLVDMVITADRTYLSVVISLVFLIGLGLCGRKVWQTSRELNRVRESDRFARSSAAGDLTPLRGRDSESGGNLIGALRLRLAHRIVIVRHIANSLVLLGLIGTVVGFIIALSGVDPKHASDVNAIAPMVSTLVRGMSTALYTTLVGAVLNVWLMANHHLLAGGTIKLLAALMESAEEHARN